MAEVESLNERMEFFVKLVEHLIDTLKERGAGATQ
jgi:hypothetical protein